jgi:putative zinc finger/helix-turn-helix YgiT family protein
MVSHQENYHFTACGLDSVTLVGIEVWRCASCGAHEAVIPHFEALHREIALQVAQKRGRLLPKEVRFLRKHLDLTSAELARRFGIAKETVSRWENVQAPQSMGALAERLLRLMVLAKDTGSSRSQEWLAEVAQDDPAPLSLRMRHIDAGWQLCAA